jgi:hypothetical protein
MNTSEKDKIRGILIDRDQYEQLTRDLGFLLLARLTPEQIDEYVRNTADEEDE